MNIHSFIAGQHFIGSLFYGDDSGLENNESKLVMQFLRDNPQYSNVVNCSNYAELAICEITGQLSDCLTYQSLEQTK